MPLITNFKNPYFEGRYLPYSRIETYLKNLSADLRVKKEGESVLNHSIFSVTFGTGPIRILAWSQMHGNESTSTKALLDFFEWNRTRNDVLKELQEKITLKVIPVLNPDGALAFTRYNACQIDLNRDAIQRTQPESRLLQEIGSAFQPDFAFNMHDQDAIYQVGKTGKSAILSFLAPGTDDRGTNKASRKRAMQVIAAIFSGLTPAIPNHIGRYKDEFNPNCMGEYFQMQGISTLLFESGHVGRDYSREIPRKYVFNAFLSALHLISQREYKSHTTTEYFAIPSNSESFYDVIIREVEQSGKFVDIAVRYEEKFMGNHIQWVPRVEKIGNLKNYFGHHEIQGQRRKINGFPKKELELNDILNKITLNNDKKLIYLTNN